MFRSNGLLPLPSLRGPTFAELDQSADTEIDELQLLPSPRTPRSRPSKPDSGANVSPDLQMDVDAPPVALPLPPQPQSQPHPPIAIRGPEPTALDPSVPTAATNASNANNLAGVIERMQKEQAAERLLWRKDVEDMRTVYESRVHELKELHQHVLVERDSREKLLISELEEMKARLARSDERIETVIQAYLPPASVVVTPLSSPSRPSPRTSASAGATASGLKEQRSPPDPQIAKPFSMGSFAPPPLFTPGLSPSANPSPKTQKSRTS